MTLNETPTILTLFRKLQTTNDVGSIKTTLQKYEGDAAKNFTKLVENLGDDLSKYKYVFDLVLKINKENPKVTFRDIYFKFLSTSNFEKHRRLHSFLNTLSVQKIDDMESLIYEEDGDSNNVYNEIISSMDKESGLILIKGFLKQRELTFEEYYYQKYLSEVDKFKNKLQDVNGNDTNKLYYRYPWINDAVVSKVFIASTEHDIDLFIENADSPTVYKSKTWYNPNTLFYNFITNQSNTRVIKGNDDGVSTLEFSDEKSNVTFTFHILYKLFKNDFNFSFVLLDETIFNLERKFLTMDYDEICDDYHVNIFLDDPKMFEKSKYDLLLDVFNKAMSNLQSQYKVKNISVLKLPIMKEGLTLRHVARKIAEVTVFLHLDLMSQSIFKKRVIRNYYKPDMIFDLSFEEKLPELLYDTQHTEEVMKYLNESIDIEIFNIGLSAYKRCNNYTLPSQPKRASMPKLNLKYMVEDGNHNYIYYNQKDEWIHLKTVLNETYNDDDIFMEDIQERVRTIFDKEEVMKKPMSQSEFEGKYKVLFELFKDVFTPEDIMKNYKDLFLYCPDPDPTNYNDKQSESTIELSSEEIAKGEKATVNDEEVMNEKVNEEVKATVNDEEVNEKVNEEVNEEVKEKIEDTDLSKFELSLLPENQPPLLSEIESIANKQNASTKQPTTTDEFNYDEIDTLKTETQSDNVKVTDDEPKDESNDGANVSSKDVCCRCKKRSKTGCTSTFTHSSKNNKAVKCVTYCYDCLETHTLDDH
jgi:hypothetical protein